MTELVLDFHFGCQARSVADSIERQIRQTIGNVRAKLNQFVFYDENGIHGMIPCEKVDNMPLLVEGFYRALEIVLIPDGEGATVGSPLRQAIAEAHLLKCQVATVLHFALRSNGSLDLLALKPRRLKDLLRLFFGMSASRPLTPLLGQAYAELEEALRRSALRSEGGKGDARQHKRMLTVLAETASILNRHRDFHRYARLANRLEIEGEDDECFPVNAMARNMARAAHSALGALSGDSRRRAAAAEAEGKKTDRLRFLRMVRGVGDSLAEAKCIKCFPLASARIKDVRSELGRFLSVEYLHRMQFIDDTFVVKELTTRRWKTGAEPAVKKAIDIVDTVIRKEFWKGALCDCGAKLQGAGVSECAESYRLFCSASCRTEARASRLMV
jgi:hypothetical protein